MYDFDLLRPATLDAALAALSEEDVLPLSGGQTLIPSMKSRLIAPRRLVSLAALPELRAITHGDGILRIGAAMRHAEVARAVAGVYPALAQLAGGIGDPAVRNRGTIGGSLANNDPAACYPAGTLGSVAIVHTSRRDLSCDDYFVDLFTTALDEGEIVTGVTYHLPLAAHYIKYRQTASGFALVGVFYARYADHCRIAVTGAGQAGVFRWHAAEDLVFAAGLGGLENLGLPEETLMSDIHADAAYRAAVIGTLVRRCVMVAES